MKFTAKTFDELTTTELYEILKSRGEVFLIEQNIHYLDMDNVDYNSLHCFLTEGDRVVAYLRAYYSATEKDCVKIGRVLTLNHGKGIGKALIAQSIPVIRAKLSCKKISMDAQTHAIGFYEKFGFKVTSEEFLEEGIPHKIMELEF